VVALSSGRSRPLLRLVLAVSLDGRLAPAAGGAAQIGGRGDRRVLEESLAWADGCLIGAETLRRHGTTCLIRRADLLAQRAAAGREPQPLAVVVSRSGVVEAGLPFFAQPLRRWRLDPGGDPAGLAAGPGAPAGDRASAPAGFERQLCCGGWQEALEQLALAGLERLVVLGGARLVASLVAEGWLDELQLTLCPQLLGGAHSWLPATSPVMDALRRGWRLQEQRLLEDNELLLRYDRPSLGGDRA
jgi:5-amino-6-(5-phosphoribosylamino)uracil reductase